jgi:hypothetical protein
VAWSLLAAYGDTVALLLAFTAFMVVGSLIVAHRPGNAVGWVFCAVALLAITGALGEEWARFAATRPRSRARSPSWPPCCP